MGNSNVKISILSLGGHEYLPDGRSRGFNENFDLAIESGYIFEGFGQERRKKVLSVAFEHGINFLDVTQDSEKEALGRNLKGIRPPYQIYIQTRPEGMVYTYDEYNRKMAQYDLPIWIHPFYQYTGAVAKDKEQFADYRVFTGKEDPAWAMERAALGLPAATASAMTRLVYSGVFDTYPDIKFITHHCGSNIPYVAYRIEILYDMFKVREGIDQGLTRPILEYYKMFYADSALHGNAAALMCGYDFFGAEHILFGSDMPFDSEIGLLAMCQTVESIEKMEITDIERRKIFEDNARELLRLRI